MRIGELTNRVAIGITFLLLLCGIIGCTQQEEKQDNKVTEQTVDKGDIVREEDLIASTTKEYDFFDLTSTDRLELDANTTAYGCNLGDEAEDKKNNIKIKVQVTTDNTSGGYYILGLCKKGSLVWDGYGYQIRLDSSGEISIECGEGNELLTSVKTRLRTTYELEYGIVDMYDNSGILAAKKIYVNIDGKEVCTYLDTEMKQQLGSQTNIVAKMPLTLSTTRNIKQQDIKIYDFRDLTLKNSIDFEYQDKDGNTLWGHELGTIANANKGNIAVKLTVDTKSAVGGQYSIGLCKETHWPVDHKSGYMVDIHMDGNISIWSGDGVQRAVTSGKVQGKYILECGVVNMCDETDSVMGKKVYVKIDGKEVLSYLDMEQNHSMGNVISMMTTNPITLSTTKDS